MLPARAAFLLLSGLVYCVGYIGKLAGNVAVGEERLDCNDRVSGIDSQICPTIQFLQMVTGLHKERACFREWIDDKARQAEIPHVVYRDFFPAEISSSAFRVAGDYRYSSHILSPQMALSSLKNRSAGCSSECRHSSRQSQRPIRCLMLEEGRRRHLLFDRKADYRPVAADNDLVDRRSVDTGADFVLLEEGDPLLVFEVGKKDIGEYSLKVLAHLDADLFADRDRPGTAYSPNSSIG